MAQDFEVFGFCQEKRIFYVDGDGCKIVIDDQKLYKYNEGLVFTYQVDEGLISLENLQKLLKNEVKLVKIEGAGVGID